MLIADTLWACWKAVSATIGLKYQLDADVEKKNPQSLKSHLKN